MAGESFGLPELHFALFCKFFHHELLINPSATDLDAILVHVSTQARTKLLHWPYRFGRELYDKFNDQFTDQNRTDHLLAEHASLLLAGTSQGVYQLYDLVCGPLGLLRSHEYRHLPPTLQVPLWHCSDTGCSALHNVGLRLPRTPPVLAEEQLERRARDTDGPASEWYRPLFTLQRKHPDTGKEHFDLPVLLAEGLVSDERNLLLERALSSKGGPQLREHIARNIEHGARLAQGAPAFIVRKLEAAQILQLLTTMSDSNLLMLLDSMVGSSAIIVPPGELRRAMVPPRRLSQLDRRCELSSRGVRAHVLDPVVSFSALVVRHYEAKGMTADLKWRLRKYGGTSTHDSLVHFLRDVGPRTTIRALLLGSEPIATAVGSQLALSPETDEEALVDTITWKLGFDLPSHADTYPRFRRRLEAMNDVCAKLGGVRSEDEREEIRKAGVNLFVSAEEFVARLVTYVTWLLSSDHVVSTRFTYEASLAAERVGVTLGPAITSGGETFEWKSSGENSLGTLLAYTNACRDWIRSLTGRERESVRRPAAELPHFASDPDSIYPFQSRECWADFEPRALVQLADDFDRIVEHLRAADLAFVRNGLDHKRDDHRFPELPRIQTCVSRLKMAFDMADERRLVPKRFWLVRSIRSQSGVVERELKDYRDRTVTLWGPSVFTGIGIPEFRRPVILAPHEMLGHAGDSVLFAIKEKSAFSDYWEGYPRRRSIPPEKRTGHEVEPAGRTHGLDGA
jgi:hypothetical protein